MSEEVRAQYFARIKCWKDTQKLAETVQNPPFSFKVKHTSQEPIKGSHNTKINVEDIDCIDCGLDLLDQGFNPLILNLADPSYPGGMIDGGAATQEESLFRRTNLCKTLQLRPELYPICSGEAVLSPQVRVLKTAESDGWKLLQGPPRYLDFVACPGVIGPKVVDGRLTPKDAEKYRVIVEVILQAAIENGNDVVVLGALGCGAFKGPPVHIAEIFKEVINSGFSGAFKKLTFAILRPNDAQQKIHNRAFQAFKCVFD